MNEKTLRTLSILNANQLIERTYNMLYTVCAMAPNLANDNWLSFENIIESVAARPDSVSDFAPVE